MSQLWHVFVGATILGGVHLLRTGNPYCQWLDASVLLKFHTAVAGLGLYQTV